MVIYRFSSFWRILSSLGKSSKTATCSRTVGSDKPGCMSCNHAYLSTYAQHRYLTREIVLCSRSNHSKLEKKKKRWKKGKNNKKKKKREDKKAKETPLLAAALCVPRGSTQSLLRGPCWHPKKTEEQQGSPAVRSHISALFASQPEVLGPTESVPGEAPRARLQRRGGQGTTTQTRTEESEGPRPGLSEQEGEIEKKEKAGAGLGQAVGLGRLATWAPGPGCPG